SSGGPGAKGGGAGCCSVPVGLVQVAEACLDAFGLGGAQGSVVLQGGLEVAAVRIVVAAGGLHRCEGFGGRALLDGGLEGGGDLRGLGRLLRGGIHLAHAEQGGDAAQQALGDLVGVGRLPEELQRRV